MKASKAKIVIEWSDEDQVFIASMPDFGPGIKAHGNTYGEAIANVQEAIQALPVNLSDLADRVEELENLVHSLFSNLERIEELETTVRNLHDNQGDLMRSIARIEK